MNERELRMRVQSAIHDYAGNLSWLSEDGSETPLMRIESYGQRRIITASEGFVCVLSDGSEFQITVTQSKLPNEK